MEGFSHCLAKRHFLKFYFSIYLAEDQLLEITATDIDNIDIGNIDFYEAAILEAFPHCLANRHFEVLLYYIAEHQLLEITDDSCIVSF